VSSTEFAVAFWPMLVELIKRVREHPYQCEELFTLAHTLFKRLAETSLEFINLDDVVRQWSALLLYDNSPRDVGICSLTRCFD
jgi:ubiquitin carboxyl-terminal hydrolase 34